MSETAGLITETPGAQPGLVIRKFTDSKIGEAIDGLLASIPDNRTGAVVAYADRTGAKLAAMAKLGEQWSVVMVTSYEWKDRDLKAEVALRFCW